MPFQGVVVVIAVAIVLAVHLGIAVAVVIAVVTAVAVLPCQSLASVDQSPSTLQPRVVRYLPQSVLNDCSLGRPRNGRRRRDVANMRRRWCLGLRTCLVRPG